MKGLPQYVLLNFRFEFPKSDLTIYLPSGISEIFRQMVSTQRCSCVLRGPPLQFGPLTYQPIEWGFVSSNQSAL